MCKSFSNWLIARNLASHDLSRFLEVSELFSRSAFNALFDKELMAVVARATPEQRNQLQSLRGFDWVGYVDRSLRNAGFREHDLDELVQEIVVRLLVQPGQLFKGWTGQPLDRRFKASVKNAVLNIVEKRGNRRRLLPTVKLGTDFTPRGLKPSHFPARQIMTDSLIDEFREFLRKQIGQIAVVVFNWRLEKRDTKELVGRADFGNPTSYQVKKMVQAIKSAARDFAQGDSGFLRMIEKAMQEEAKTVQRRKVAVRSM
jgi:DNA-directed RNA polymerase specialized sigma24 family protein